ncbi:MAG: branched-chain amino acid ABC transporter permease [Armatimonadota bacterium]|nr:branched-chain amino acid ABC transporter permease [Armatimonadota bacterium]
MFLLEQVINGLTLGSLYGLVAVGLALILGVARFVNLAHGQVMMLSAYLILWLSRRQGLPYVPAVLLTVASLGTAGVLTAVAAQRVIRSSWRTQLVATLAAAVILESLVIVGFGAVPQVLPTDYSRKVIQMAGLFVSVQRLLVFAVVATMFAGLQVFLAHSRSGKATRAVAQNRELAEALGVDTVRVAAVTFGIAFGLAGLAGTLVSPLYTIYPAMGTAVTFKALAAVVMGGFGQVTGTLAAALLLGVAESLASGFGLSAYQDSLAFLLMIGVLVLRPQGLFGTRVRV